jgi:hypothetical protein
VESPHPAAADEEEIETVTAVDLGALHRERLNRTAAKVNAAAPAAPAAAASLAPLTAVEDEPEDKALTIKDINEMKKEDVHRVCAIHGIDIDGKNILDLKKALKSLVK